MIPQAADHPAGTRLAGVAAVLLIVAGLSYLILFRVVDRTSHHAFDAAWRPPQTVALTSGAQYQISVRGGADAVRRRRGDPSQPRCTWSTAESAVRPLRVSALPADSRALNVVGTFTAPTGGAVRIECSGWGPVSVDDSDDSSVDLAGLFVLLAIASLVLGCLIGLGALYGRGRPVG